MTNNGNIRVRVDSKGVEAELDSSSAKKFGELVSPFTSLGKALGDRISIWGELWNFEYAIAAAERAHVIAERSAIPITPKSPKFLRSWAINASLEEDERLIDKWAMLLLNASNDFSTNDAIYVSILSKLGGKDATFLDKTWDRMPEKRHSIEFITKFGSDFWNPQASDVVRRELSVSDEELALLNNKGGEPAQSMSFDQNDLGNRVVKSFLEIGFFTERVKLFDESTTFYHGMFAIEERGHFSACMQLGLWGEGTARFQCGDRERGDPLWVEVTLHGLTDLGLQFLAACKGYDRFKENAGE